MAGYGTVASVFSQISGVYDRFLGFVSGGRIHRWQRALIDRIGEGENILDIGTGTGEVLIKAGGSFKGLKVGLDPAEGMLKRAGEKCPECRFVMGVGEYLPFKESVFDAITLSLVFRHLEDQSAFLKEANRVLRDGGRIGILDIGRMRGTGSLVWLMKTLFKVLGVAIFGKDKWDFFIHSIERSYTPEEVSQMLKDAGFRVDYVGKRMFGLILITVGVKTA